MEGEHQERLRRFIYTYITENFIKDRWSGDVEALSYGIGPVLPGMIGIRDTYSASFKAMRVGHMLKQHGRMPSNLSWQVRPVFKLELLPS